MQIQDYSNQKKRVDLKDKKRQLYKKYLNLGVEGVDPTKKESKEVVSRKGMPTHTYKNESKIECLPGSSRSKPPKPFSKQGKKLFQ